MKKNRYFSDYNRKTLIFRYLTTSIRNRLNTGKAIILLGPRQCGKTTLLKTLFEKGEEVLWLNGDDPETLFLLDQITTARWRQLLRGKKTLILDEAQRIVDIGLKLKLVTDQLPEIQVVASGSSAFELANRINEPLTGRKWEYLLYPLSFPEMVDHHGLLEERRMLPQRLVFGYYPEVVTHSADAQNLLNQLTDSYLYKDILTWDRIRKPEKIVRLLQAISFQLGQEVSFHELGQLTDLDSQTVENYIRLLEQAFIIYRLPPLSRNLRKELKTKRKIYFFDNGIRNAVIAQFQPIELRQDIGALWENWFLSERLKRLAYQQIPSNRFFWRTQDQQEIDYIEERNGFFHAYELKWNPKAKVRFSKTFTNAYPEHTTQVVHRDNFDAFLLGGNVDP